MSVLNDRFSQNTHEIISRISALASITVRTLKSGWIKNFIIPIMLNIPLLV